MYVQLISRSHIDAGQYDCTLLPGASILAIWLEGDIGVNGLYTSFTGCKLFVRQILRTVGIKKALFPAEPPVLSEFPV